LTDGRGGIAAPFHSVGTITSAPVLPTACPCGASARAQSNEEQLCFSASFDWPFPPAPRL